MTNTKIISTSDNSEIELILSDIDPQTLVVFDYNNVIAMNEEILFSSNNIDYFIKIINELKNTIGKEKIENVLIKIREHFRWTLVNLNWPTIIAELQLHGIKVLLLTAHRTGKVGNIEHIEDTRINDTLNLGIDFSKSWKNFHEVQFTNFSTTNNIDACLFGIPIFKKGILFSCNIRKSDILNAFLHQFKIKPQKIIFIDDSLKNVRLVQGMCDQLSISYLGIEYTAVEKLSKYRLSYEEAKKRINNYIKSE